MWYPPIISLDVQGSIEMGLETSEKTFPCNTELYQHDEPTFRIPHGCAELIFDGGVLLSPPSSIVMTSLFVSISDI